MFLRSTHTAARFVQFPLTVLSPLIIPENILGPQNCPALAEPFLYSTAYGNNSQVLPSGGKK